MHFFKIFIILFLIGVVSVYAKEEIKQKEISYTTSFIDKRVNEILRNKNKNKTIDNDIIKSAQNLLENNIFKSAFCVKRKSVAFPNDCNFIKNMPIVKLLVVYSIFLDKNSNTDKSIELRRDILEWIDIKKHNSVLYELVKVNLQEYVVESIKRDIDYYNLADRKKLLEILKKNIVTNTDDLINAIKAENIENLKVINKELSKIIPKGNEIYIKNNIKNYVEYIVTKIKKYTNYKDSFYNEIKREDCKSIKRYILEYQKKIDDFRKKVDISNNKIKFFYDYARLYISAKLGLEIYDFGLVGDTVVGLYIPFLQSIINDEIICRHIKTINKNREFIIFLNSSLDNM